MKILYVGRFAAPKNNLAIIKICKILKHDGISFSLDFYGDAENVDNEGINIKKSFLNDLDGLNKNIKYSGYVDKIDIFSLNYDFLILPSFWEGFPVVMLEAAKNGIIPICSDIQTGPREFIANINEYTSELVYPFIGQGGVLLKCPVNDVDFKEWANCLESIYSNKELLNKLKYSVKRNCKEFSFENYRLNWENFLDSLSSSITY
jgi:glycosyltransferase involved in cell wall biosynthesis